MRPMTAGGIPFSWNGVYQELVAPAVLPPVSSADS